MSIFYQILEFLRALINWWFVVEPWEQAVRVRFGKHVRLFGAGVHVRIPFFDKLYLQNVRRRVSQLDVQTLTASDGKSLTVNGSIGYRIADVLKLQQTLHHAEQAVRLEVAGLLTKYVVTHPIDDCKPGQLMDFVKTHLDLSKYGLADVDFFLIGYVSKVSTIRVINDSLQAFSPYSTALSSDGESRGNAVPR